MKKVWGKIIGASLGFMVGRLFGAIVGFIVGHIYDMRETLVPNNPWTGISASAPDSSVNAQQAAFTMGVIVLGAKMAKADGRVTMKEIEAFKKVFNIAPAQVDRIGKLFDRARESADGFEPYAFQLSQTFRNHPTILEEVLNGLFLIAAADTAGLSPAESRFLKRVAYIFNFDPNDFRRIAARAGVRLPLHDAPDTDGKPVSEPFAILGVHEEASNDTIKLAYRNLIRKHHPDKLVAEGMAPEFIATANEKMKRINNAYSTVCKLRGIR